jgi:hypothetical protein
MIKFVSQFEFSFSTTLAQKLKVFSPTLVLKSTKLIACSVGWWLMAGAGLF